MLLFLVINQYFLVLAIITKDFNSIAELVIPKGISTKEAKEEIKGIQ